MDISFQWILGAAFLSDQIRTILSERTFSSHFGRPSYDPSSAPLHRLC